MSELTITYKGEKLSLVSAVNLMCIANTEEAEELFKAIQKVSPSKAIRAREIRELSQKLKALREQPLRDE